VKKGAKLAVGEFARVQITDADAYDLTAVVVKEKSKK
jgi:hypothetical protein